MPHPVREKRQGEGAIQYTYEIRECQTLCHHYCPQPYFWWNISTLHALWYGNSSQMLSGKEFQQMGARAEKALLLDEVSQIDLGLETTSKFFPFFPFCI